MDYRSSRGHWWLHHAWWSTLGTTTNHDPSSVLVALSLVKRWAGVTWDSGVWEKDMEIWWWTKSFNAGSSWAGESAHLYTVSYGKFGCFFSFAVFFWIFFAHASTPPIYRARWYIKLESIRCADVTRKLMSKDEYGCCLNMLDIVGFERVWIWTDVHIVIEYEMYIYIYTCIMYLHLQAIFKTRKACWSWSSIYIVWIISPTLRCIPESSPVCSSCGWWSCRANFVACRHLSKSFLMKRRWIRMIRRTNTPWVDVVIPRRFWVSRFFQHLSAVEHIQNFWSCLYFPGTLGMLFVFRNHIPRTFLHLHATFKGTWFPTLTCGGTTWTCGCGGWRGTR